MQQDTEPEWSAFSWYPGHMTRAFRQIQADLRQVDLVMLVMDARIPRSSRHHRLEQLMAERGKPVILVLNKADLAEPSITQRWIEVLRADGLFPVRASMTRGEGVSKILRVIEEAREQALAKAKRAGRVGAAARLLIAGIPNVGKSSLINRIAPRGRSKVGKQPGVTRGRQWVTLPNGVEMLDSPGILFPSIRGREPFVHLAAVGAIKEDNLPLLDIGEALATELERHKRLETPADQAQPRLEAVARRLGMLLPGGVPDLERAAHHLLKATREGRWGPLSFERPDDPERSARVPRDAG